MMTGCSSAKATTFWCHHRSSSSEGRLEATLRGGFALFKPLASFSCPSVLNTGVASDAHHVGKVADARREIVGRDVKALHRKNVLDEFCAAAYWKHRWISSLALAELLTKVLALTTPLDPSSYAILVEMQVD